MNYIIYASKRSTHTSEDEVDYIIDTSEKLNAEKNISGVLLVQEKYFLQYFEGDKEDVVQLMEKLYLDNRHYDLKTLHQGEIDTRLFPEWAMAPVHFTSKHSIYSEIITSCPIPNLKHLLQQYLINESPIQIAYM